MAHSHDVLLDDRALVEVFGGVMGGGADHLHATVTGLVVWLRTRERGQERVVDIDDAVSVFIYETGAEDLHISGQHDKVHLVLFETCADLCLLLDLASLDHRQVHILGAVELDEIGVVGMVADHDWDLSAQLTTPPPVQKVLDAMRVRRDKHTDTFDLS